MLNSPATGVSIIHGEMMERLVEEQRNPAGNESLPMMELMTETLQPLVKFYHTGSLKPGSYRVHTDWLRTPLFFLATAALLKAASVNVMLLRIKD